MDRRASMTKKTKEANLHGIIVVDKPARITSHDVVGRIRRLTGIRRVGHAGTLDPFATGVVVLAVGRATRVLQFIENTDKRYLAHIVLGAATDTGDVEGAVVERPDVFDWPDLEQVESVLPGFRGQIEQIPPIYSAIKVGGQPLYRQARAGKDVTAPPRVVQIHAIEILDYDPPNLVVGIYCGKGTYIRSLARDIGAELGTSGYCHSLRRTAVGRFCLDQAWTLDELTEVDPYENWHTVALHPDFALVSSGAVILSGDERIAWYHGQSLTLPVGRSDDGRSVRAYGPDGDFLGVGRHGEGGSLQPAFVFNIGSEGEQI